VTYLTNVTTRWQYRFSTHWYQASEPHVYTVTEPSLYSAVYSKMDFDLRKKLAKCYIWSIALYGAETWMLRAEDQKHLKSAEMWCWRRMEKVSWTVTGFQLLRRNSVNWLQR
jgi:hypothetical protein